MSELQQILRRLHAANGFPSYRTVSRRTGGTVSHTAVMLALNGPGCPRWATVQAIAEAMGADPQHIAGLRPFWEQAQPARKPRKSRPRITEGVVVRPGDVLVFTLTGTDANPSPDELQELQGDLAGVFPDNPVRVILGANLTVIKRKGEAA